MNANIEIDLNAAELAGLRHLLTAFREAQGGLSEAVSSILVREGVKAAKGWTLSDSKMIVAIEVNEDPPETAEALSAPTEPAVEQPSTPVDEFLASADEGEPEANLDEPRSGA